MYIDEQECTGCGVCVPYCPVGAISDQGGVSAIDFDECVECGTCISFVDCPGDALHESPETSQWPRSVRREFSNPMVAHPLTGIRGRGTEEMKTNDVTGRVKRGQIGIGLEFGRPAVGARLRDVEKMALALESIGVSFEPENPVASLMVDPTRGAMKPEVRNEKVLSAIIEIGTTFEKLPQIVATVREVAATLDTVISWEMICRYDEHGAIPLLPVLQKLGITPRPNAKINLGMGTPLVED